MTLKIAQRGKIPPFIVMDVMARAEARAALSKDVLHLEVGQPSTGAPKPVLKAAAQALESDLLGYSVALGLPALRERIALHYQENYAITVPVERIVITTGSSAGFLLAFLSAFDAGDRVALAAPGYPAYRNILSALGVEPVLIPVDATTHFQPDIAAIEKVGSLDGIIVASPSNPTGGVFAKGEVKKLAAWCQKNKVRLVSDEIYHGIVYEGEAISAASFEEAIIINSFSKYYAMTGWRLGWMVVPEELLESVERLAQNFFISAPTLSQIAAIKAFSCRDILDENVKRYAKNRAVLQEGLPKAGFDLLAPADGAFYLYANVERFTDQSDVFCRRMLDETGIAITPGMDFDPVYGRYWVRFSFAGATSDMIETVKRLRNWRK